MLLLLLRGGVSKAPPDPNVPEGKGPSLPAIHLPPGDKTQPSGAAPLDVAAAAAQEALELAQKRLARAQQVLSTYRDAHKYPPQSRPIWEHPDQIRPEPLQRKQGLKRGGDARLRMRQDRFYVVGDESVRLAVGGEDSVGNPLPLKILSAVAAEAPFTPGAGVLTPVNLTFADDGAAGDEAAGDGWYTAVFQPARQGFQRHLGGLRVTLVVRVGDEEGSTFFDLYYTSSPPAEFTGQVREAIEGGTLNLYVGMNVRRPGRYVLAARADEAGGKPFAYLSFNDVLREGPQEVKFPIFGKLVRDQNAATPFRLRDLEGFLLKEDADPDREVLVPRLGVVHVTRAYPESAFSDVEWDSEEKRRHLEEFEKDVREAENEVGSASGRR